MIARRLETSSWVSWWDRTFFRFDSPVVLLGFVILIVYGAWWAHFDGGLADFGSFVASGRAAGEGLNPYGAYPLTFRVEFAGQPLVNYNLNPPLVVLLFQAIGTLDPWVAFEAWFFFQALCYGLTIWLLLRAYPPERPADYILWLLALGCVWDTLALGQIYLPMALIATAGWIQLDRRKDVAAGLLIGLMAAIKPNLVVWPIILFLSGYRRVGLAALASIVVLGLLPVLAYGPDVYREWVELVLHDANRIIFPTNMSFAGLTMRFGVPWLGTTMSVLLLIGVACWAWLARPSVLDASAVALVAALLSSPIAWVHYIVFLLPVFFYRAMSPALRIAALLLTLPVKVALFGSKGPVLLVTMGSVFNYALLLLLIALLARTGEQPHAAGLNRRSGFGGASFGMLRARRDPRSAAE